MQIRIILIHGFLENASMWNPLMPAFEPHALYIPDLPGHGNNSEDFNQSLIPVAAGIVKDIQQKFPEEHFVLIGHSMGGYIAAEMAFMIPEKVIGLCFFHSTAQKDSEQKQKNRQRAMEALAQNKDLYIGSMIRSLFADSNDPGIKDLISQLISSAGLMKSENIHNCLCAMRDRNDLTESIKSAEFPVAYLMGDSDSRLPLSEMMGEMRAKNDISSEIIENCGHMSQWEKPKEAIHFLRAWLNEILKS